MFRRNVCARALTCNYRTLLEPVARSARRSRSALFYELAHGADPVAWCNRRTRERWFGSKGLWKKDKKNLLFAPKSRTIVIWLCPIFENRILEGFPICARWFLREQCVYKISEYNLEIIHTNVRECIEHIIE